MAACFLWRHSTDEVKKPITQVTEDVQYQNLLLRENPFIESVRKKTWTKVFLEDKNDDHG